MNKLQESAMFTIIGFSIVGIACFLYIDIHNLGQLISVTGMMIIGFTNVGFGIYLYKKYFSNTSITKNMEGNA